jgi:sterol desaturase/sphingolipid hydroxylase (fatty acid hydroxylase superfamily)
MRLASAVPLIGVGFAPVALVAIAPLLTLMAIVLHANLDWDFGPLRTVIASPRFHRWHHTDETAARDKNFAGLFPLWDILFGTYYMPTDRTPTTFGTSTPVPRDLIGQLKFPFRRT